MYYQYIGVYVELAATSAAAGLVGYSLGPNIVLPTRTDVAPRLIASSKSPLMPMLSSSCSTGTPSIPAERSRQVASLSKQVKSFGAPENKAIQ